MKLPSYALAAIEERRDSLYAAVLPFCGQPLTPEAFASMQATARERLPAGASDASIFESCRYLAGRTLNRSDLLQWAWRIAGNQRRLSQGQPVLPWTRQDADEWVPLQCLRATTGWNTKKQVGAYYTYRIMAGSPAGMTVTAFWTRNLARLVASRVGFSRYSTGKYPYRDSSELVGLRFYGLVEAARSNTAPVFYEVACPDSLVTWNRENVLKLRARVDPCPRDWQHPCHHCAVGYTECPGSVHRLTYEIGPCTRCHNQEAVFDPEESNAQCRACVANDRRAGIQA